MSIISRKNMFIVVIIDVNLISVISQQQKLSNYLRNLMKREKCSILSTKHLLIIVSFVNFCQQSLYFRNDFQYFALQLIVG